MLVRPSRMWYSAPISVVEKILSSEIIKISPTRVRFMCVEDAKPALMNQIFDVQRRYFNVYRQKYIFSTT
jgi:hypothetical protein